MKLVTRNPSPTRGGALAGFTLVEIMVTSGIFLMVVMAMVAVQIYGLRVYTLAATKLTATQGGRETLNNIRDAIRGSTVVYVGTYTNGAFLVIPNGQQQIGNASGLYNLMRNLGGSIGIAFVTTMLARGAQVHQALMVGHLTPTDPAYAQRLAAAKKMLSLHTDPVTATHQAYAAVYALLDQQAHLWAFVDNFFIFGLMSILAAPLIFLFKRVTPAAGRPAGGR